jgi:hypothetical protein
MQQNNVSPRDQKIMNWQRAKASLDGAKELEMQLRKEVVAENFPDAKVGVNNLDITGGWKLKGTVKQNYSLDKSDDCARTDAVCEAIADIGNEGPFIIERLVKWKPEISVGEYKKLQERAKGGDQFAVNVLEKINTVLTITDGSPELEVIPPKGA